MMKLIGRLALAGAVALVVLAPEFAFAAASTQTAHSYLCSAESSVGASGPRRVVNTSSTATPQPSYLLNGQGCTFVASGDVGFFLTQGFTYGQGMFSMIQTAITASTTSTTSTLVLPSSGYIMGIVLAETAGNAITGGVDIGDSGSATRFASAVALSANNTVAVTDAALTRVFVNGGLPASDQILVACHTACNSGSINITIFYTLF
jgi:hypothetical protein